MAKRILVVDDDREMSEIIKDTLSEYGYEPFQAGTLCEANAFLEKHAVELIILDINMPDGVGFDFCRELRRYSDTPILFASARTMEDDRIRSLDIGGDDFLSKPFSLKELLSHVNALFRRNYGFKTAEKSFSFADVVVNCTLRTVTRAGKPLNLSLREFDLLEYFLDHANTVIPKEKILGDVWGVYNAVEPATLTVHVRWLREKLEENPSEPKYLTTVRGMGYSFQIPKEEKNFSNGKTHTECGG